MRERESTPRYVLKCHVPSSRAATDAAYKQRPPAEFDYRYPPYDTENHIPHPNDCSLVTFRGHAVLSTLIRCHFSPPGSTDSRYIYTGSHDGKVYIYNLDGTQAGAPIDVYAATKNSRPNDSMDYGGYTYGGFDRSAWNTIVRDCSWHPSAPLIAATSWNGPSHQWGTCTVHSWNDDADVDELGDVEDSENADGRAFEQASSLGASPTGARVSPQLMYHRNFYRQPPTVTSSRSAAGSRGFLSSLLGGRATAAQEDEEEEEEEDDDEDYEDEDETEEDDA
jgi:WD repeat-containing protein 23